MSLESVIPSNHLTLHHPLLLPPAIFPSIRSFQMSQFLASGGQSIGASASASVLPMNIQDWFPLGWSSWISLLSKGLSRVFSNKKFQKHQFFSAKLSFQSNSHILVFWMLSFKPTFSFSSFTLIKRLFSSSSLSAIEWCYLYIWSYWNFSQQFWFQLVFPPVQHFSWCTLI